MFGKNYDKEFQELSRQNVKLAEEILTIKKDVRFLFEAINEKPIIVERKGEKIIPFSKDFHPEFDGWIGEKEEGVWISYISSKQEGKGNFSKLLKELKAKYEWIKIPTPSNKMLKICQKKGFILTREYFPEPFNETGDVLLWKTAK